jgi:hypothetical protein
VISTFQRAWRKPVTGVSAIGLAVSAAEHPWLIPVCFLTTCRFSHPPSAHSPTLEVLPRAIADMIAFTPSFTEYDAR